MAKITLSDIASDMGVSKALISFVLNSKGDEMRISKELQKKVKIRANELGYRPNILARGLRKGTTETFGLIIPDISNPFFAQLSRAVENEAKKNGYDVIFCSSDENPEKTKNAIELMKNRQVDGLILIPSLGCEKMVSELLEEKFPFILIDRFFNRLSANSVILDNYNASKLAVKHLIKLGNKKIGFIHLDSEFLHLNERVEGYRDAILESGLSIDEKIIKAVPYDMGDQILDIIKDFVVENNKIDALFLGANVIGISALQAIMKLNIKMPKELAVVCFDDPKTLKLSPVPITTIRQPIAEIGKRAVEILIDDMKTGKRNKGIYQTVKLTAKLIVRDSCGSKKV